MYSSSLPAPVGAGRVISETFADAGAKVLTCDVDTRAVAALRVERPDITALEGDVSVRRRPSSTCLRRGRDVRDPVDVLVNNLGIAGPKRRPWRKFRSRPTGRPRHCEPILRVTSSALRRVVPRMKSAGEAG